MKKLLGILVLGLLLSGNAYAGFFKSSLEKGPVNKMIKAYTDEFSFMRHQTMRDQRPSKK